MNYSTIFYLISYVIVLRICNDITISGFIGMIWLLLCFWLSELCSNYIKSYSLIKFLDYYPNVDCYLACDYNKIVIGGLNVKN